ncbi:protein YIF1B isoform X2 [Venturia canescens]|uniref:protein YIF1B isoform X2 n=1 Tax=Venturia canescens TaxID=32260 RepID=UPI001C9D5AF2|nr:protein YIF1B isoform X2 [Venturia canescens]
MNYNHSGARRGKPKRILDPSTGLSSPASPPSQQQQLPQQPAYTYNQQQQQQSTPHQQQPQSPPIPPRYGFEPMQSASPYEPRRADGYSSQQFASTLLAEPIVTNMALQYGNALVGSSKQQLEKYVPVSAIKYYFAVDTDYVFVKLAMLFLPFTHKDWSVKYEQDGPLQPRYERNAPDMYIPTMAFLTYVVMAALSLGMQERFSPEHLGILASTALAWGFVELLVHWITLYVMNIETSLTSLDLLAYCGYKYVGINAALLFSLVFRRIGYYAVLCYYGVSLATFLTRSLKLRVVPEGHTSYTASGNKRRLYFILFVAFIQPLLMWWLSYHLI